MDETNGPVSPPSAFPGWLRPSPGALIILIALSGSVAFGAVAVVLSDNPRTATSSYYGIISQLSADAAADITRLAPTDVLESCLRGDESGCLQQGLNARAASDRLGLLADGIGANTPTFDATIWHSAYLDTLGQLRLALNSQVEAIEARDADAFSAAVEATRVTVSQEEALTTDFNERFGDELAH